MRGGEAARRRRGATRLAPYLAALALTAPAGAQAAGAPPEFYGAVSQAGLAAEDYARMKENGIGLLRIQLSWKKVQRSAGACEEYEEPVPGVPPPPVVPGTPRCDWAYYDRIFGGAAAAGVELMPYFLNVPQWISERENEPPIRAQEDRQAWVAWVQAAVRRYGPGGNFWANEFAAAHPGATPLPIGRWQVWNEPSDGTFWHPRPDPAEYGHLVEITAGAIRGVDPAAEVVLAGVFGSPNESDGGIDAKPYLRRLFRSRDLGPSFDSLGLHPYGPTLKRSLGQVRRARKVFAKFGFADRPTWITELGWASGGDHSQLSKTPAQQAKLLRKAYRAYEKRRVSWGIAGVTWFAWQDTDDRNACAFCAHAGLITVDRQAKPALDMYRRVATGGR